MTANPTITTCSHCGGTAVLSIADDGAVIGSLLRECPECGHTTIDTPNDAADAVMLLAFQSGWSLALVDATLRRNYWVQEMSKVPRAEARYTSHDGPGTNRYTQCSYRIAQYDEIQMQSEFFR